ncbi:mitotic spindle organizing protein Mzt1 [Schizosaccharomyces osmophilus]|uniref:Mitotic-spindle organizing protein 1 n=1 Tax=Schizosaccharomyces osmophilus TaxID=2545709 RepID=A0AAE9WEE5_9SCHI|nr:mitotic spindle organizing protein Mzt1 [Schizosaccharomyces osmophilus]WBW74109.1 mitotic spindle organizing protein Mzt1 [Schizosaccharomyces osmophilus]
MSSADSAKETIDILHEIGTLLGVELDKTALSLCVSLCENNIHPEAVAQIIREIALAHQDEPESDT